MNPETGPATTRTTLLGGRVVCEQPAAGFRVAIDAVLLAAAVPAAAGQRALELGSGSGAAALCLAARVPGVAVLGLELQANLALLATRNTALSGLADRVAFVAGDELDPPAPIAAPTVDHVF
ncbi:MAG: methyltransferase, partial [Rhodospirillaceae bacterium]